VGPVQKKRKEFAWCADTCIMRRKEDARSLHRVIHVAIVACRSIGAVTTIIVVGVLLSGVAAFLLQSRHEKDGELVFTRDASALAAATQVETSAAFSRLNDLASFLAVAGVPTQSSFQRYLQEANLQGQDWLEGTVFIEPVGPDELQDFVAREYEQSGRRVDLRLDQTVEGEHWLVSRTVAAREDFIGVDVGGIPGGGPLIDALRTDRQRFTQVAPATAGAVNIFLGQPELLQAGPDLLTGVIPVRDSVKDERLGWLLVQIRVSELVSSASTAGLKTNLRLVNFRQPGDVVAFSLDGTKAKRAPADSFRRYFTHDGMEWELRVWSDARVSLSPLAAVVLILGSFASLALGLLLLIQRKAQSVRQELTLSEENRRRDDLTGLPNRVGLGESLDEALAEASTTAVLFCDLDRFKVINDSLGHQVGDELLKVVARRLRASLRQHDVVGRFGGDEFVAICADLNEPTEVEVVADRILKSVARPMKIDGAEIEVAASVGIAVSTPEEPRTCHELLRDADLAMYAAKRQRSGRRVFDGALRKEALDRLEIESALRTTLKDDLLRVEYQPILNARGHELVAVEALARFNEPVLASAGPQRVIPIAEETGLVGALGARVLELACSQMAGWNQLRPDARPLQMCVNVAEAQLGDPEFPQAVRRALQAAGLPGEQLVLEVPERAITKNMQASANLLRGLAGTGAQISIDDFGTGQSSLAEIMLLTSICEIKIDRSLVSGPGARSVQGLLISAITEIARGLDARLVAEGVETQEQLARATVAGADRVQGFLFSASQRPEQLDAIVSDPGGRIRPSLRSEQAPHIAAPTVDA